MKTENRENPKSERFAINKLQLLEHEYADALRDLENEESSFSVLSDVCLPVSLLVLIVIWGYQMNATAIETENADNRMMLLVYGVGLIVVTGSACVYIAIRMAVTQPPKAITFLPGEFQLKPLSTRRKSQRFDYQTIPGVHSTGKKITEIFIV